MPVQWVRSNPRIYENIGKLALTRGPIVYCLEEVDNGADLHLIHVGSAVSAKAETSFEPGLFHGVMTITTPGLREEKESWDATTLYAAARAPEMREVSLVWIPYYAWANRGIGEMRVWVHA